MIHIKDALDKQFIRLIDHNNPKDSDFIDIMTTMFSVNALCDILGIDRNRYNYLKRTDQLNEEILKIRKEVQYGNK